MFHGCRLAGLCWLFLVVSLGSRPAAGQAVALDQDYPVTPVAFTQLSLDAGFWLRRFETNRQVTIRYDFEKCRQTGRLDNFAKAGRLMRGEFRGIFFDDSDVFKVIEGASYSLAAAPDAELDAFLDRLISWIAAAQEPDGYLYTARTLNPAHPPAASGPTRWSNEKDSHELYNAGHLYEAAVAHYQATGKRALLDVAIKSADLVSQVFGPAAQHDVPGHQEIEIGLVKLYRATGERKYLQTARFLLDERGRARGGRKLYGAYCQDHRPVVEQDEAVGHAVRAAYMYSGMADVAALTGDREYIAAIDRLWENVVAKKLYLTGGIGARREGEAFGDDYELPNRTAYNETCAAIANALWNQRMFLLHADGQYVDVLERILYNGFLSGVSLSGDTFFYPNPLEADGHSAFNIGRPDRQAWFDCACCPVNVVRFVPSIAGYAYATRRDELYVNLFLNGTGSVAMSEGAVKLTQSSQYPWDGRIRIAVEPAAPRELALHVRVPGWALGRPVPGDLYTYRDAPAEPVELRVNGELQPLALERGYAVVRRQWHPGDTVELWLPMPVRRVAAHPLVAADVGRVAIERGPIVYCAEGIDHGGRALDLVLPDAANLEVLPRPELFDGVSVIETDGQRADGAAARLRLIPYYAWNHRGTGEMAVWLLRERSALK